MADEIEQQEPEQPGKKSGARRLPIWIVAVVAVELIAALAVVQILVPTREPDDPLAWMEHAEMIERDIPSVVVNLRDGNAKRLLRVHVTLRMLAEHAAEAKVAVDRPGVLEDRLVNLLSKKRLHDVTGRQEEIKTEIRELFVREIFDADWRKQYGEIRIEEILMPEFVIQ